MRPSQRSLVSCILLLGWVPLAGCLAGFDEHKLRDPSAGTADAGGSNPSGNTGSPAPPCLDFGTYTAGSAIPHWVDGRGMWRTVAGSQGVVLGQLSTPSYNQEKFVGWYDMPDLMDVAVRVTIQGSASSDNCAVARLLDENNYYLLCVRDDHGGQGANWDLSVMAKGSEKFLSGNSMANATTHTVVLQLQGTTLTPIVDGKTQPSVTDGTLARGAAGVTTESTGVFPTFCLTPM